LQDKQATNFQKKLTSGKGVHVVRPKTKLIKRVEIDGRKVPLVKDPRNQNRGY